MTDIIYTPLDIPCKLPDEDAILDWFHRNTFSKGEYWEYKTGRHKWAWVSSSRPISNWLEYDETIWNNRRTPQEDIPAGVYFNDGFEEEFPELADVIRALPFKQLTVSGMLYQIGEIPLHFDTYDKLQPLEPRRYTIYLTNPDHNTFYFDIDGKIIHPTIDKEYCAFAFNNSAVQHGALKTVREKIILTCAGIIDDVAHEELINRSIEKFKDKVISI